MEGNAREIITVDNDTSPAKEQEGTVSNAFSGAGSGYSGPGSSCCTFDSPSIDVAAIVDNFKAKMSVTGTPVDALSLADAVMARVAPLDVAPLMLELHAVEQRNKERAASLILTAQFHKDATIAALIAKTQGEQH